MAEGGTGRSGFLHSLTTGRRREIWHRGAAGRVGGRQIWHFGPLAAFTDVRELQRRLKAQGVQFQQEADESTTGPASFLAVDPDGNPILVDQHV